MTVAHLLWLLVFGTWGRGHFDAGIVVATDDEITDTDGLLARCLCTRAIRGEGVVQAPIERVGQLLGIANQ